MVITDLPWARGKLDKVVVMVNKNSGLWNGSWVIMVWKDSFHAKAFKATINYHQKTTGPTEEMDGSIIKPDEQGHLINNYRYNQWLPKDARLGLKGSSGTVATLEDSRDGIINQPERPRSNIVTRAPVHTELKDIVWNNEPLPENFKKGKPDLLMKAIPLPQGLGVMRAKYLLSLIITIINFTGVKIWMPAWTYDGEEANPFCQTSRQQSTET